MLQNPAFSPRKKKRISRFALPQLNFSIFNGLVREKETTLPFVSANGRFSIAMFDCQMDLNQTQLSNCYSSLIMYIYIYYSIPLDPVNIHIHVMLAINTIMYTNNPPPISKNIS